MYNKKIKEMALKNREIRNSEMLIYDYREEIEKLEKLIKDEKEKINNFKIEYEILTNEAEKLRNDWVFTQSLKKIFAINKLQFGYPYF